MPPSPDTRATLPNRQSIRKRGWNYAEEGWYFVTINTHGGRALFGAVVNGRMLLKYVLAHCDRLVVGHLNPSGMLACILSEANPEKEIIHL